MKIVRLCAVSALLAALALVPRVASAQAGTASDFLSEIVLDHNAPPGAADVPLTPPAVVIGIPEGPGETTGTFPFPGRVIDFMEQGPTAQFISDRLIIGQYQVNVVSDDNPGGLPRRTQAELIPRSALETFLPFSIIANSDGNQGTANQESDHLTIVTGYYGPGTGKTVFDMTLFEPPVPEPPGGTEPDLDFVTLPLHFDIEEPLVETGGIPGIISDYVDVSEVHVHFISSDDQSRYFNDGVHVDGFVFENIETGGGVSYALGFSSDAVPEPTSLMLIGLGTLALAAAHRRRAD